MVEETALLTYDGINYTIFLSRSRIDKFSIQEEQDHSLFMWTEGNFGCDCNRSDFIHDQCEPLFEEMSCGNMITLKELRVDVE